MSLKLFHSPDSRSSRMIWLLEESRVPYTIYYVDIPRRSGAGAQDERNPHPDKRVPALTINGVLVTECAAIALCLSERFPKARLGPPPGSALREVFLTWIAYYAGEVEPAYASLVTGHRQSDVYVQRSVERVVERVAGALSKTPYLLGRDFSAADVLVSGPFEWLPAFGEQHPQIGGWLQRLRDRPAAQRARDLDSRPAASDSVERRAVTERLDARVDQHQVPVRFAGFR